MDDTEVLRLRALAKAKAMRMRSVTPDAEAQPQQPTLQDRAQQIMAQPGASIDSARAFWNRGNTPAGNAKVLTAIGQGAAIPFSLLDAYLRTPATPDSTAHRPDILSGIRGTAPVNAALDVVGFPFKLAGDAAGALTRGALSAFGVSPETSGALGEAAQTAAPFAVPFLAKAMVPPVRAGVGGAIENIASKTSGRAFGAGENFMRTEQLGKFAQENAIPLSRGGLEKTQRIATQMNNEINSKIIDPAVQAGVVINGEKYIQQMMDYKKTLSNRAVPDEASMRAVDRMIDSARRRLAASPEPGFLTPDVAQKMKVENNQILADTYRKMEAGGNINEQTVARKAALVKQTDALRSQLEEIHPELKKVNWYEGQALQLNNAIYDYLNRQARGESSAKLVGRGGVGKAITLSVYDMLHVDPIRSRLGIVLGKIGRGISGNKPDIPTGVQNPFSASRWTPPFSQPTQGPVGNIPRPPLPSNGPQPVNAPYVVMPNGRLGQSPTPGLPPKSSVPTDEAPVSRGGSMGVRGSANQAQIDQFFKQGKLTLEQAIKYGVSPALIRQWVTR